MYMFIYLQKSLSYTKNKFMIAVAKKATQVIMKP